MNDKMNIGLLSPEERDIKIISEHLAVELEGKTFNKADVLSAIASSGVKCIPRGMLRVLVEEGLLMELNGGFRLVTNDKGGENMSHFTRGEAKVAESVVKKFGPAFLMGKSPSRMVFESCLVAAFPKIKNGKVATKKLLEGEYLLEREGKILLGEKGKDILSQ